MADDAEPAAAHGVRRQAEIHDVEYIEKFRAKLEHTQLAIASFSEWSVLDHGHVEIVKTRPAESIASKRAETPLIGACSSGDVGGNKKEGAIVSAAPKVIFSRSAAR